MSCTNNEGIIEDFKRLKYYLKSSFQKPLQVIKTTKPFKLHSINGKVLDFEATVNLRILICFIQI